MAITSNGNRWLDDLPQGWETRLLKHKLRKITDGAHVSPDTSENAYPFVSTVDIENGDINFESCLQTSAESYSMLSSQGCRPKMGDVLFSKDGTVGRTALISFDKDFVVASSLIILTPQQAEVFPAFLDFMLRSHIVLEQINSFVKGSALKRVSLLNIKKVIGVFPPVEEQIRIASYLDKTCAVIDKAIEAKQKQLGILDALRKSIIHKAVTRGLDNSVELKDSNIDFFGRVPIDWKQTKFRYEISIRNGDFISDKLDENGLHPVIGGNGFMGMTNDFNVDEEVIAIGRVGAYCGNAHLVTKQSWISDNALIVKSMHDLKYLVYVFIALDLNSEANKTAQPVITGTKIKKYPNSNSYERRAK